MPSRNPSYSKVNANEPVSSSESVRPSAPPAELMSRSSSFTHIHYDEPPPSYDDAMQEDIKFNRGLIALRGLNQSGYENHSASVNDRDAVIQGIRHLTEHTSHSSPTPFARPTSTSNLSDDAQQRKQLGRHKKSGCNLTKMKGRTVGSRIKSGLESIAFFIIQILD